MRQDLARLRGVMQLYRAQKWDEAEEGFFNLNQGERPLPLYEVFIGRIMHWRENPPARDWDGAWNFEECSAAAGRSPSSRRASARCARWASAWPSTRRIQGSAADIIKVAMVRAHTPCATQA